jgi:hypothetical protein
MVLLKASLDIMGCARFPVEKMWCDADKRLVAGFECRDVASGSWRDKVPLAFSLAIDSV